MDNNRISNLLDETNKTQAKTKELVAGLNLDVNEKRDQVEKTWNYMHQLKPSHKSHFDAIQQLTAKFSELKTKLSKNLVDVQDFEDTLNRQSAIFQDSAKKATANLKENQIDRIFDKVRVDNSLQNELTTSVQLKEKVE